jgi:hypothetical protein
MFIDTQLYVWFILASRLNLRLLNPRFEIVIELIKALPGISRGLKSKREEFSVKMPNFIREAMLDSS